MWGLNTRFHIIPVSGACAPVRPFRGVEVGTEGGSNFYPPVFVSILNLSIIPSTVMKLPPHQRSPRVWPVYPMCPGKALRGRSMHSGASGHGKHITATPIPIRGPRGIMQPWE